MVVFEGNSILPRWLVQEKNGVFAALFDIDLQSSWDLFYQSLRARTPKFVCLEPQGFDRSKVHLIDTFQDYLAGRGNFSDIKPSVGFLWIRTNRISYDETLGKIYLPMTQTTNWESHNHFVLGTVGKGFHYKEIGADIVPIK